MKNRKVLNVRTHIGGLHGKTSFDSEQDGADMELSPVGVVITKLKNEYLIRKDKVYEILLPYSNCTEILIEQSSDDEPKRGPGRPPGLKGA